MKIKELERLLIEGNVSIVEECVNVSLIELRRCLRKDVYDDMYGVFSSNKCRNIDKYLLFRMLERRDNYRESNKMYIEYVNNGIDGLFNKYLIGE